MYISDKEIIEEFQRTDITDAQKGRFAVYLKNLAYKEGWDKHRNLMNEKLNDSILQEKIESPTYKITDNELA